MMQQSQQPFLREGEDWFKYIGKLWRQRKTVYRVCGVAVVTGLIIAFSIPKEYSVTVTLSPESGKSGVNGSLAGVTSMLGLGNFSGSTDGDALNFMLFPEILSSTPFALELYAMPVIEQEKENHVPLNEYMDNRSQVWWTWVAGLPLKAVRGVISLFSDEEEDDGQPELFHLTEKETETLKSIKESIAADIDKKTGITTITVTMQDPLVAATVADSVVAKLQNYITAYRIKKATEDCAYIEKLYRERQQEYYTAQRKYAAYVDENKELYTQDSKVEGIRLQNDMNLAYQMYNQVASLLQQARAKIQEDKPVFAVVNPATVPVRPSSPRKIFVLAGVIFLSFLGISAWLLFGKEFWGEFKQTINKNNK